MLAFSLFSGQTLQTDMETGIGVNVTNANNCDQIALSQIAAGISAEVTMGFGNYKAVPTAGFNFYQWVEATQSGNTVTIFGNNGTVRRTGLLGQVFA